VCLGTGRIEDVMRSPRTKAGVTVRYHKRSEDTGEELQSNNITNWISDYRNKSLNMLKERHKLYPYGSAELCSEKTMELWKTLTDLKKLVMIYITFS
jgi:hypothetical protein